jgi:hypothetical protein
MSGSESFRTFLFVAWISSLKVRDADMQVELVTDGPVTIIIDSKLREETARATLRNTSGNKVSPLVQSSALTIFGRFLPMTGVVRSSPSA